MFFGSVRERREWSPSPEVLSVLRQWYLSFSDSHRSYVVALHLESTASLEDQLDLVRTASARPLSNTSHPEGLRPLMVRLCEKAMPALLPPGHNSATNWILDALHAQLPAGWEAIQVISVGEILSRNPEQIDVVVEDLISVSGKDRVSRNIRALRHAAATGAAGSIFIKLTGLMSDVPASVVNPLRDLTHDVTRHLEEPKRKLLLHWAGKTFGPGSHRGPIPVDISFHSAADPVIDQLAMIRQRNALRAEIEKAPADKIDGLIAETQGRLASFCSTDL